MSRRRARASSIPVEQAPAMEVIRRGLRVTPELLRGIWALVALGILFSAGQVATPIVIQLAIDRGGLAEGDVDLSVVWKLAIAGLVVLVGTQVLGVFMRRRMIRRAEQALRTLRTTTFDHVHRMSLQAHNRHSTGVLISRITADIDVLGRFVDWGMFVWMVQPFVLVGVFVTMAVYSWQLSLLALVSFVPAVVLMRWMQGRMSAAHLARQQTVGALLGAFSETLGGAHVLRAYGAQEPTRRRLFGLSNDRYRASLRANIYQASVFVIGDLLVALTSVVLIVVGITQRSSLGLSAGELVALIFLGTLLQNPVNELGETMNEAQVAIAGWRKVLGLLDEPIEDLDPASGRELRSGALEIHADGVGFAYADELDEPVLIDVDVHIAPGTRTAIVGATGSGKTTFARLLCRLADPTEGSMRLGGVDLREVAVSSRQRAVRLVPQDSFLFDMSIGENIAAGRHGSTDADVAAAIKTLGLGSWIASLPDGLETRVGERGSALSVGERQLVSFARASVADPGLLILDEATSSVDPQTDLMLTAAIGRLATGRTVVSIAHRMSTAESADLVLVFDGGRLVETGAHTDLVAAGGVYESLHRAWRDEISERQR